MIFVAWSNAFAVAWVDGNPYLAVLEVRDGRATTVDPNGGGRDLSKRIGQAWTSDKSAREIVSEMRR